MLLLSLALADTGDSTAAGDTGRDTAGEDVQDTRDQLPELVTGVEGVPFVLFCDCGGPVHPPTLAAVTTGPVTCSMDVGMLACSATDNGEVEFRVTYPQDTGDDGERFTVAAINAEPVFTWSPEPAPSCGRPAPFETSRFIAPTGGRIEYPLEVIDVPADKLSFEVSGAPESLSIGTDGVVTWTPGLDDLGTWPMVFTVRDDDGAEATIAFEAEVVLDPCGWMAAVGLVGALSARRLRQRARRQPAAPPPRSPAS